MKKVYIQPKVEVFLIDSHDVICESRQYGSTPIGGETIEFLAPQQRGGWDEYENR